MNVIRDDDGAYRPEPAPPASTPRKRRAKPKRPCCVNCHERMPEPTASGLCVECEPFADGIGNHLMPEPF